MHRQIGFWPWPMSSLPRKIAAHTLLVADIMLLRPKMRPDVFISLERGCTRLSVYLLLVKLPKKRFCNTAITVLASRVNRHIIKKRPWNPWRLCHNFELSTIEISTINENVWEQTRITYFAIRFSARKDTLYIIFV